MQIKRIFYFLFLSLMFNNSYADHISDQIAKIGNIINMKSLDLASKERRVEPIVKDLMNYDRFFSHITGKEFWNTLTHEEKKKAIDINNKNYVKNYFNKITSCDTFEVKEVGDPNTPKRSFSYKCNNEVKNLDIITKGGRVLDVQLNGVSFINVEKETFNALNTNDAKKNALFEVK